MSKKPAHNLEVAAAALNTIPLDFVHNEEIITKAVEKAREKNLSILCLPELCITGYGCEDAFLYPHVRQKALQSLKHLLPITKNISVTLGLPLEFENRLYNAVAFVSNSKLLGFVCKQYLAGDGIHYEPRWFVSWPEGKKGEVLFDGHMVPCGDQTFTVDGNTIGFEICEDAWVQNRPGIKLASQGVDIILNPSASHFGLRKVDTRRKLVLEGSRQYSPIYVYANILGNEAGRVIYDGDTLIAKDGELIGQGKRLSFEDFVLTDSTYKPPAWEQSDHRDFEEFTRVVSLGLFDYLRKSRSKGFVISLSGGADSASLAVLVYCMVMLGVKELGLDSFKQKLSYCTDVQHAGTVPEIMKSLLCCVYQKTENSSETTNSAAKMVSSGVGAAFFSVTIDSIIKDYLTVFHDAVGRDLTWKQDDITLQNIQARARSPGIWLLANFRNALLLTTSNRSEAAVGYATMDGDTSGSVAPIAGIDKHFIQRWLSWMETKGISETGPLPFLSAITKLAPTAELRPSIEHQTDEKDLMPYAVLAAIERCILLERKNEDAVVEAVSEKFKDQYQRSQIVDWVRKFDKLWSQSQWKRERYAPSFHLDEFNIDPRSWFRFPILSGGLLKDILSSS